MKTDIRKLTLPKGQIIPIHNNFVFTGIFNDQSNIPIIEYFLADFTDIPFPLIKGHVKILSRDLKIESKNERNSQVDLLLDISGFKINIEISNQISDGIINRNIIYGCNIHSKQLEYGDNTYSKIRSTIQIQLNNFRCNEEEIKKTYFLRDETGAILSTKFQIDVVDMVMGRNLWYTSRSDRLARWCKILTATTESELEEVLGEDFMDEKTKNQFMEEVIKYSHDQNHIALYMKLPREELERNTYIDEAKTQKQIEIARNLKKYGMSTQDIHENTGLSTIEIENL